jgi:hypothetical protein
MLLYYYSSFTNLSVVLKNLHGDQVTSSLFILSFDKIVQSVTLHISFTESKLLFFCVTIRIAQYIFC